MTSFSKNVWNQLKGLTIQDLQKVLEKDGWTHGWRGALQRWQKGEGAHMRQVTLHVHPKKTMGPGLVKKLLEDIGWDEADMRRLKLIK